MRIRVIAQTPADYQAWVQSQLVAKDKAFYETGVQNKAWGCTTCHSFEPTVAGALGPNLTHLADRTAFAGDIFETNFENLWPWIYDAPARKPAGPLATHPTPENPGWMPSFKDKNMPEDEAKHIACFLLKNTATGTPDPATLIDPDTGKECTTS
jgi:hypothetical protein